MDGIQFGAVLPIVDGTVTTLNGGETFVVADILSDWDTRFEFVGDLGGDDFAFPWPSHEFAYSTFIATGEYAGEQFLTVVIKTNLPLDEYCELLPNPDFE